MKSKKVRILALVLTVWLVIHSSPLKAQSTYSSPFAVTGTGGSFLFGTDGTFTATGSGDNSGSGIMWNPSGASFRAGFGCSTGAASCEAFGLQTTASAVGSFAVGYSVTASGWCSSASGYGNNASGKCSSASGYGNKASGLFSTVSGYFNTASAYCSTASGYNATASGPCSSAFGYSGSAGGAYSAVFGRSTSASAYDSFVVGKYNVGGGSISSWVPTEPLFEVGNGTGVSAKSDALVVYKNGNATLEGALSVAPGGDIPMFSGTN